MTTLARLPDDMEDVDHLAWALDVLGSGQITPTKRVADFILRTLIEFGDFAGMDKILDAERDYYRRYGFEVPADLPTEGLAYVLRKLEPGERAFWALSASLKHFILTANFPGIEAVFDECVREFREAETEEAARAEYVRVCMTVPCPRCGVPSGSDCIGPSGARTNVHSARSRAVTKESA